MNLVSLLIAPAVVQLGIGDDQNNPLRIGLAVLAVLIIVAAIAISKRRTVAVGSEPATTEV
jgi:K(+)-stimulated pyrophosphate-energized sodium pump